MPGTARENDDTPQRPVEAPPPRRRRSLIRGLEHLFAAMALLVVVLIATPATRVLFDALGSEDPLEKADYIVCLGGDAARVIESARLLSDGYAPRLIVSNHGEYAAQMRDMAVEWGADPERVLVDDRAYKTRDHPYTIAKSLGVSAADNRFIIVTSATHLNRSRACFEKAGYRHLILREPRWERDARSRSSRDWKWRFRKLPDVVYECAAWVEYYIRGAV